MSRTDIRVYDAYPSLFNQLLNGARTLHEMPLDEMLAVLDRVAEAGCYNRDGRTVAMDAGEVARHRAVVEAAAVFRDAVTTAMRKPPGDAG